MNSSSKPALAATAVTVIVSAMLAACGGGGGDDDSTPNPPPTVSAAQGLWIGTTDTGRRVTGLVLGDGSYWVLYSVVDAPSFLGGVVQGTGAVSGSAFTSANGRDFNIEGQGVAPVSVTATATAKQSFNGSVNYANGFRTVFTATYNADFETKPSLATLAGTYSGQIALSQGVQAATVAVTSSGVISGSGNGCALTGRATPRSDGNAYDIRLTFGAAPCYFAGQTLSGIAYYDALGRRLYAAAPNAARTDGVLFTGLKP